MRHCFGAKTCSNQQAATARRSGELSHYFVTRGMLMRDCGGRQKHAAGHPEPAQGRPRVGPGAAYARNLLHIGRGHKLCSAMLYFIYTMTAAHKLRSPCVTWSIMPELERVCHTVFQPTYSGCI